MSSPHENPLRSPCFSPPARGLAGDVPEQPSRATNPSWTAVSGVTSSPCGAAAPSTVSIISYSAEMATRKYLFFAFFCVPLVFRSGNGLLLRAARPHARGRRSPRGISADWPDRPASIAGSPNGSGEPGCFKPAAPSWKQPLNPSSEAFRLVPAAWSGWSIPSLPATYWLVRCRRRRRC
jgi:hypothetical protein